METIKERLEYLRNQLQAENISYGELIELQSLAQHIEPGDVELLQAAGVPEFDTICDITGELMDEGFVIENGIFVTHIKYKKDLIKFFRDPKWQAAVEEDDLDIVLHVLSDEELLEFLGENEYYYWTTFYEN